MSYFPDPRVKITPYRFALTHSVRQAINAAIKDHSITITYINTPGIPSYYARKTLCLAANAELAKLYHEAGLSANPFPSVSLPIVSRILSPQTHTVTRMEFVQL